MKSEEINPHADIVILSKGRWHRCMRESSEILVQAWYGRDRLGDACLSHGCTRCLSSGLEKKSQAHTMR